VFLDLFDHEGAPFDGPLHPHSGIATLTYVAEGAVSYIDPGQRPRDTAGRGRRMMQAGRGMWHGGGLDHAGGRAASNSGSPCRRNSNWVQPSASARLPRMCRKTVRRAFLLGRYGSASSAIASALPINYLAVRLKAGERWRYEPPKGHTVLWVAVASGDLLRASRRTSARRSCGLRAVERSGGIPSADRHRVCSRLTAPHEHDLVTGYYSVHTSARTLRNGETHIASIRQRLIQEGRL